MFSVMRVQGGLWVVLQMHPYFPINHLVHFVGILCTYIFTGMYPLCKAGKRCIQREISSVTSEMQIEGMHGENKAQFLHNKHQRDYDSSNVSFGKWIRNTSKITMRDTVGRKIL